MAVNGQVVMYEGAAPTASDVPERQDLPAIAYKQDGTGPILTWNTETLQWDTD